ncbi:hypothetical protein KNT64_gp222 [Pseudomonas phage PspYZU05]|uniref:Uncharacterized protein n=1 Tax=Pseudomonas phage PspYZU05 TaxID=1983556 RepID=A0A2U7NJN5_9CAUD|nr:hypothetical protein KNT64_gp222 [Pseudomonas phage PspYZU05]ASD52174.1 hypothetical protein PspYZU05_222 [Pseudomonas phage PspYZU05]
MKRYLHSVATRNHGTRIGHKRWKRYLTYIAGSNLAEVRNDFGKLIKRYKGTEEQIIEAMIKDGFSEHFWEVKV